MISTFYKSRKESALVLLGILVFLLNTILPYFPALNHSQVNGYTTVICSLYGSETVFISFDGEDSKNHDDKDCRDCFSCLFYNHPHEGLAVRSTTLPTPYFLPAQKSAKARLIAATKNIHPQYFSRAPPA